MSQSDFGTINPDTKDGTNLAADLNGFRTAVNSSHSGSTRPAYATAGIIWMSTAATPWVLYMYDGADDISLGTVNAVTNTFYPSQALLLGGLDMLFAPSVDGAWRDILRSGWVPDCFNQQWGGAQWGGLPDGSFGDVATGNIQDDSTGSAGFSAGTYFVSSGFKVPESGVYDSAILKLYKVLNPTATVTVRVYSDAAGSPNAAIGSASTNLTCSLITSNVEGSAYTATGLAATLVAGTQYHLVLTLSTTSATDYLVWKRTANTKYPYGHINTGTSVPTWTPFTGYAMCFIIPNLAAQRHLQTGGQFDGKMVFNESVTYTQSKGLRQSMRNFFDGKNFTFLQRYNNLVVSKPIVEFAYGVDHDRIQLATDASGHLVTTLYDAAGGVHTITGTAVITGAGFVDIAIAGRFYADGSDYLKQFVNGVSDGTPLAAQTFVMDSNWRELGTARIGGAMPLAPSWTVDTPMTALPSAAGWTYAGSTEATCQSVAGGKCYANANGIGSTQSQYSRVTTFVNATGSDAEWKGQISAGNAGFTLQLEDAAKKVIVTLYEYYLTTNGTGAVDFVPYQMDLKSSENVITLKVKGSDYFVYANGTLIVDGTNKATTATANNLFTYGNLTTTAAADVVTDYVKLYVGGTLLPQYNSGACLHEAAYWSGDKTALLPYAYNAGSPVSIKQLCGVEKNYVGEDVTFTEVRRGVTASPTTASPSYALLSDMECYLLGSSVEASFEDSPYGSAALATFGAVHIDGVKGVESVAQYTAANTQQNLRSETSSVLSVGLHMVAHNWLTSSGTSTSYGVNRRLSVKAKA